MLHKHPDRHQTFDLSVGTAHVFRSEAGDDRCAVALLLDVDPIGRVRNRCLGGDGFWLAHLHGELRVADALRHVSVSCRSSTTPSTTG